MEQLKWETKKVKVKDLIQLDINPRKISEDKKQKLIESLEKFNLVEIPAVNTDLQIIGGYTNHGRAQYIRDNCRSLHYIQPLRKREPDPEVAQAVKDKIARTITRF